MSRRFFETPATQGEKMKKIIALFLTFLLIFYGTGLSWAQVPEVPEAPSWPTEITPPPKPESPSPPSAPEISSSSAETTPTPVSESEVESEPTGTPIPSPSLVLPVSSSSSDSPPNQSNSVNGQTGETVLNTGEVTVSAGLVVNGNSNDPIQSVSVMVDENGQTVQENQIVVNNGLDQAAVTGGNSASLNVGNSVITTGEANATATVVNAVNTNIGGVDVAEFNIVDDHEGDIILNFDTAFSNASGSADVANSLETFQNNEAVLENNLTLLADTGQNQTSLNTGGDSLIQTGNANATATVANFLNNNLTGNIILGVVNIFGNLKGDIVVPEKAMSVSETSNLAAFTNSSDSLETFQTNNAQIENNLNLEANTGENEANRNTNGDSMIESGEATATVQTVNIANNNIESGSWWLVIINQAGEWLGRIIGAPEGATCAVSEGAQLTVNENGEVVVSPAGDNQTQSQRTEQNNEAKVVNNISLSANTGRNRANDNTGGDSLIKTGDAKVILNLINFVNNNISSGGRLIVTVVNVFGSWIGDFLPPGVTKPPSNNDNENDKQDEDEQGEEGSEADNSDEVDEIDQEYGDDEVYEEVLEETEEIDSPEIADDAFILNLPDPTGNLKMENPMMNSQETDVLSAQAAEGLGGFQKPFKINLAWLTVLLPVLFLSVVLRRFFFRH